MEGSGRRRSSGLRARDRDRVFQLQSPGIEGAAGDHALDPFGRFASERENVAKISDAARGDDRYPRPAGKMDGGGDIDALQHPVAADVGEQDRSNARVLELAGEIDRRDRRYVRPRSEEHTSELQSLMRISYAVFCLKKKTNIRSEARKDT